ncbi:hypothetical protein C4D60_Mb08t31480 [Musa balbisiana]|uniref:Uncharacterized protein n=1 Tax=Musa balbisiana TaxID=52838 RepID=A0A4S8K7X0_MUSBA|nr:hypothetical protein C4D60_Mb08t31480 [Musa balbisiana]
MHRKAWLLHRLFDYRLEENVEERELVTTSGGELGRLNIVGGAEIGPLPCWPGDLCLSRSPGDVDAGEFIISVPHVKQVKMLEENLYLLQMAFGMLRLLNGCKLSPRFGACCQAKWLR